MKRFVWLILLVLPLGAMAADIYRSVDENGQVVYSDRPTRDAERITISAAPARPPAAAAAPAGASEETGAAEDPPVLAEVPRESTPEEIAADRARNCEYSQQMLESYTTSHRLYRQGPDGEREYLTAEEIDAARARAQSNVASWCD